MAKVTMPSDEKAQLLLDAIEDRKAVDPVVLDLRGKTLLFDFFLVCSGTSNVHIRALADAVLEKAEDARLPKPAIEGKENAEWILLDFGDVILHIMDEESRERYRLEQFWSTPHPKGALPPTPSTVGDADSLLGEDTDEDAWDEEDEEDAAFFADADREVEPIDEDDFAEDAEEDEDDAEDAPPARGKR